MLVIGEVVGAHGVRGELKIYPHTDFPERFLTMNSFTLQRDGNTIEYRVLTVRRHKNVIVASLAGIDSRDAADTLRGCDLVVPFDQAVPLPAGEWYIYQLMGAEVATEDGTVLGTITKVLSLPANDAYEVEQNGRNFLIPALKDIVLSVDIENKKVIVRLWEGMLE